MKQQVVLRLMILIMEICFAIWDETSDIIYTVTQQTFDPIVHKFLIFFIIASPLIQMIAYMIILSISQLKNRGHITPNQNEEIRSVSGAFQGLWVLFKVYVVYFARVLKYSIKYIHLAFLITLLQEVKIFGPVLFWYIKKRYNVVFTKQLMEGIEPSVESKRQQEQDKLHHRIEKKHEKKLIKKEKQKQDDLNKRLVKSQNIRKLTHTAIPIRSENDIYTNTDLLENRQEHHTSVIQMNASAAEKLQKGEEEYQIMQEEFFQPGINNLIKFNSVYNNKDVVNKTVIELQNSYQLQLEDSSSMSPMKQFNRVSFKRDSYVRQKNRRQIGENFQSCVTSKNKLSIPLHEIRDSPNSHSAQMLTSPSPRMRNNNNKDPLFRFSYFQKPNDALQQQNLKKSLILFLDAKMKPDLSVILQDKNFQHLMLVGNLFEALFECLPQAILQFLNNQLTSQNDSGWTLFQIITFASSCITLFINSIRLVHLLLGDKLDIFLGTLNFLKDDKDFIKNQIEPPKTIVVENDTNLLQKLSLLEDELQDEQIQEISIKLTAMKSEKQTILMYLDKILQKRYSTDFKKLSISLINCNIDKTYAVTMRKKFLKNQQVKTRDASLRPLDVEVDIDIDDYYFQDQIDNPNNKTLDIKEFQNVIQICDIKDQQFFQRIKRIMIDIEIYLETDPEKLKKIQKKMKKFATKLKFPNLKGIFIDIKDYKSFPKLRENSTLCNEIVQFFKKFRDNHTWVPDKDYVFRVFGVDVLNQREIHIKNYQSLQYYTQENCENIEGVAIDLKMPISKEKTLIIQNLLEKLTLQKFNNLKFFIANIEDISLNYDLILYNNLKLNNINAKINYFPSQQGQITYKLTNGQSEVEYLANKLKILQDQNGLFEMNTILDLQLTQLDDFRERQIDKLDIQMTLGDQQLLNYIHFFFQNNFQKFYDSLTLVNRIQVFLTHNLKVSRENEGLFYIKKLSYDFDSIKKSTTNYEHIKNDLNVNLDKNHSIYIQLNTQHITSDYIVKKLELQPLYLNKIHLLLKNNTLENYQFMSIIPKFLKLKVLELNFSDTSMTDTQARTIISMLIEVPQIRVFSLDLSNNPQIFTATAECLCRILEKLNLITTLTLNFNFTKIQDKGKQLILNKVKDLPNIVTKQIFIERVD